MAKQKQHVFSARTTEEGLRLLNELKKKLNLSWDELVVEGMCGHYSMDRAVMSLPKKGTPAEVVNQEQSPDKKKGGKKAKASKKQQIAEQGK